MTSIARARRAELEAALAELAGGCRKPADVARKLAEAGCQGERGDCSGCPIAVWLIRKLPGPRLSIVVSRYDATASWESEATWNDPTEMPESEAEVTVGLPRVLSAFVEVFDIDGLSKFPELDVSDTAEGEHFEVYPASGSPEVDTTHHGRLGHDEAHRVAAMASRNGGPDHRVDRVTICDGEPRRNRIAEYRNGERIF